MSIAISGETAITAPILQTLAKNPLLRNYLQRVPFGYEGTTRRFVLSCQPVQFYSESEFLRFQAPVQDENLQRFILFRHNSGMPVQ